MSEPTVKVRLSHAKALLAYVDNEANYSPDVLCAEKSLRSAIGAADAKAARRKAKPLSQAHEKPSKAKRNEVAKSEREEARRLTSAVYKAVRARAAFFCECGCCVSFDPSMDGQPEMDHFWGRSATGDKTESVETCWMLRRDHHRQKTDNKPTRRHWLAQFRAHCSKHGYSKQLELAEESSEAIALTQMASEASRG